VFDLTKFRHAVNEIEPAVALHAACVMDGIERGEQLEAGEGVFELIAQKKLVELVLPGYQHPWPGRSSRKGGSAGL